jgi:NAD+ kinase
MGTNPIPTIGVNFGKFGYLTDIRSRDVTEELEQVLAGRYVVEERLVLRGTIPTDEGPREVLALNEFYFGPQTVGRITSIELTLDGAYATTYRGDGLLVATPTGSTGHSLSAGGPIVDPELAAMILTPVSPHSLTNRPLVVPPQTRVRVTPQADHTMTHATVSADGQVSLRVPLGESAEITRAAHAFPLVRSGRRSGYDVLRTRLGWSGQPPYEAEDL